MDVLDSNTFPTNISLTPACYSKFGPTVVIFKFNSPADEDILRKLDRCGVSESKVQDERIYHVSVPVIVSNDLSGKRSYSKAFPDVSDEKLRFWSNILDGLEYLQPDDFELLKISSNFYNSLEGVKQYQSQQKLGTKEDVKFSTDDQSVEIESILMKQGTFGKQSDVKKAIYHPPEDENDDDENIDNDMQ